MAVQIEVHYSKKLGLPGYSSHQFAVTLKKEIADLTQVERESTQLYRLLQDNVDREIQHPGFIPGGEETPAAPRPANGNGSDAWRCSDKQKDLILRIITEHDLDRKEIDQLAQKRFETGLTQLNRLQASGLIDELIDTHGNGKGSSRRRPEYQGGRR